MVIYAYITYMKHQKEKEEKWKTGAKISVNKRDDQKAGWREGERF